MVVMVVVVTAMVVTAMVEASPVEDLTKVALVVVVVD